MYQDLFDKVTEIIQKSGKDVLNDNKFWYILMDEYSFQSNPILKMIFKEVLNSGYVNEITKSFLKKQSLNIIRSFFDNFKIKFPDDEDEIIASLFSIPIGLGKCTLSDYNSFNKRNNPSSKNQNNKKKNQQKKSSQPSCLKPRERYLIWAIITSGLFISIGGTLLYWYFFKGTEMASVILFITIIQFPYAGFVWLLYSLNKNPKFRKTLILTVYPFAFSAFINSFLWFPLIILRKPLGNYLELYGWINIEDNLFFTFLFGGILFYGMFKIWKKVKTIRKNDINGFNRWISDKSYPRYTFYPLLFLYILFCIILPCFSKVSNYYGSKGKVNENHKIAEQRSNEIKDLSYMGIGLGENYNNVLDSVKKISPVVSYADCLVVIKGNEPIWQVIDSIQSNHIDPLKDYPELDSVSFLCQHFWQHDSLYNQPIDFCVYGLNNVIQLITLEFKGGDLKKKEFKSIAKIYEEKYGIPESYNTWNIKSYGKNSKFSYIRDGKDKEDILIWTFQNGLIYLSNKEILYLSKSLCSLIQQIQE
ncbi:MAG: hypothetical protein J1F10_03810 [Muribaculaceae bacterium]|nr:hypothetical protein [Muribaculaceae bacterium]